MTMDERTRDKFATAIKDFVHDLIRIADEENYDRDSFVRAGAEMFFTMTQIGTFESYDLDGGDGNG